MITSLLFTDENSPESEEPIELPQPVQDGAELLAPKTDLTAEDINASWHSLNESLAESTDDEVIADEVIDCVDLVREYVASLTPDTALDAELEKIKDPFLLLTAVELAYIEDFQGASDSLALISDGSKTTRDLLMQHLEAATVARAEELERQKLYIETSSASAPEQVEGVDKVIVQHPRITVNTQLQTLFGIVDPVSHGRYLSVHEHATAGGIAESKSSDPRFRSAPKRNEEYRDMRARAERRLGYSHNAFLPPVVYGALSSEHQLYGGASQYGDIVLNLRESKLAEATFTPEDSMYSRELLGLTEAVAEHGRMLEKTQAGLSAQNYIEAQFRGLRTQDIESVRMPFYMATDPENSDLLKDVMAAGVEVEVAERPTKVLMAARTEEEAIAMLKERAGLVNDTLGADAKIIFDFNQRDGVVESFNTNKLDLKAIVAKLEEAGFKIFLG